MELILFIKIKTVFKTERELLQLVTVANPFQYLNLQR